jgi:flagellar protein FlbD
LVNHLITLHRFNSKKEFILNVDQIRTIEETPDTVITLITNEKVLVNESAKEIVRAAIEYSRAVRTPVDYLSQPHF